MTADNPESWVSGLDALFAQIAGRFRRVEPRRQARSYVLGLLAPIERKSSWQLAEAAGDGRPDRMQRLLGSARWDPREVREDLHGYVVEQLGRNGGVLVVDDIGFAKKGTRSAGVQRQSSGSSGRPENCQIGVFLGYATRRGLALADAELYLPRSWTEDRDRCARAGVPADVGFATRPALAQAMVARALEAGSPARWVAADEVYGQAPAFRRYLEDRRLGYVMAVQGHQPLPVGYGDTGPRADEVAAAAPPEAWKRLPARTDGDARWQGEWAVATLLAFAEDDIGGLDGGPGGLGEEDAFACWLLVRRPARGNGDRLDYHLCHGPAGTAVGQLVRVARACRTVGDALRAAKEDVGLDQYQVRRYDAWHRHVTLAMIAHAHLAAVAARAAGPPPQASAAPRRGGAVIWHI
nr:IS701 family transposase [Actinomadura litoris]